MHGSLLTLWSFRPRRVHRIFRGVLSAATPTALILGTAVPSLGARLGADLHAQPAQPAPNMHRVPVSELEVLGLRRWTVRMLRDSLARRVPGATLESDACQVLLRDSLHFPDALVHDLIIETQPNTFRRYLTIKLVEPQDRRRVRWTSAPPDSFTALRPAYAAVALPITDAGGGFWLGRLEMPLQYVGLDSAARAQALDLTIAGAPPAARDSARADAERLWGFLAAHRSTADYDVARTALRRDGYYVNRVIAATVLSSFPERDSTWWALAEALRDPNEAVRSIALVVLTRLPAPPGRVVDWAPVVPTLRLLLGGTNVAATEGVMHVLARTRVSPALAGGLLRENADWVRAHLRAHAPGAREAAHALLVQLNGGQDLGQGLGPADAAWHEWLRQLSRVH